MHWKNRLKLEPDKAEVLNVFFASAKRSKERCFVFKVPLAPVLKGRVQGRDLTKSSEIGVNQGSLQRT